MLVGNTRHTRRPGIAAAAFALAGGLGAGLLLGLGPSRALAGDPDAGHWTQAIALEEAILFEPRSSRLTERDRAALDRLSGRLRDNPEARLLVIVPDDGNRQPAGFIHARLLALDMELGARGINPDRISMRGGAGRGWLILQVEEAYRPPVPAWYGRFDESSSLSSAAAEPTSPALLIPADGGRPVDDGGVPPLLAVTQPPPADPGPAPALVSETDPGVMAAVGAGTGAAVGATPSPDPVEEAWEAPVGQTLQQILDGWSARAAWSVVYRSNRSYPVEAPATFHGDFVTAASRLIEAFGGAAPAPLGQFYTGNKVLVVTSGEGL